MIAILKEGSIKERMCFVEPRLTAQSFK
jgi:hypothetical protein